MHNLTFSGGKNKFTYNFGYTFNQDKAIVVNSSYRRHLANFRGDYAINSKMKLSVTARIMHQDVFGAGISIDNGGSPNGAANTSYNRLRNTVKYRPFLMPNQSITDPDAFSDPNAAMDCFCLILYYMPMQSSGKKQPTTIILLHLILIIF
ncbi:MAG: hypothetical protein WDM90_09515 [Ferruginibacter sp.]